MVKLAHMLNYRSMLVNIVHYATRLIRVVGAELPVAVNVNKKRALIGISRECSLDRPREAQRLKQKSTGNIHTPKIKGNYFNNGFTMVEFLLSFSVFLLVVTFFPIIMGVLALNLNHVSYETDLFFEHLRMEIVEAKSLETNNGSLLLIMDDGRKVSYEKYEKNIRRRVNGAGNEILIQGVTHVSYQLVNNGVVISLAQGQSTSKKRLSMAPLIL